MSDWTEAEDAKLRLLLPAGYSASQIAVELGNGRSRNSVIGRANRMGLSIGLGRPRVRKALAPQKIKRGAIGLESVRSQRTAGPTITEKITWAEFQAEPDPSTDGVVRMIDVIGRNGRCKFPLPGEDGLHAIVCGERADSDNPYCAHHHKLSRTPLKPRAA